MSLFLVRSPVFLYKGYRGSSKSTVGPGVSSDMLGKRVGIKYVLHQNSIVVNVSETDFCGNKGGRSGHAKSAACASMHTYIVRIKIIRVGYVL